ncbi:MAG: DUF4845 domain-containing protein [Acidobacteria bacterium]|nr:DUF4845 domain-containing protein [Acidobacteriota bacterium]
MKSIKHGFKSGEEGKGALGCIFSIILVVIVIFLAIQFAPAYFNYYGFKGDLQQAVSRAGAQAVADDVIIQELIKTAEKNSISLKKENIQIRRFSGQLYIEIKYAVPINFFIMKRDYNFKLEESSFTL